MDNPTAGAVIEGTGGLRKLRQADPRRGKGKRGGLVVTNSGFLLSMTKTKQTI